MLTFSAIPCKIFHCGTLAPQSFWLGRLAEIVSARLLCNVFRCRLLEHLIMQIFIEIILCLRSGSLGSSVMLAIAILPIYSNCINPSMSYLTFGRQLCEILLGAIRPIARYLLIFAYDIKPLVSRPYHQLRLEILRYNTYLQWPTILSGASPCPRRVVCVRVWENFYRLGG